MVLKRSTNFTLAEDICTYVSANIAQAIRTYEPIPNLKPNPNPIPNPIPNPNPKSYPNLKLLTNRFALPAIRNKQNRKREWSHMEI